MVLRDAFSAVLIIARELSGDQSVKQAISDDIALVESKAAEGIDSLEAHIAGWFGRHYSLPAPAPVAPPVTAPVPAEVPVASAAFTSVPETAAATIEPDGTATF